jgi:hypothetical protein
MSPVPSKYGSEDISDIPTEKNIAKSTPGDWEVVLESADDPQRQPLFRPWLVVLTICMSSICVTCASSAVRASLFDMRG